MLMLTTWFRLSPSTFVKFRSRSGLAVGRQGEAGAPTPALARRGTLVANLVAGHLIVDERINCSGRESQ